MIDPRELRDLREAIEDALESSQPPNQLELVESLEHALVAIERELRTQRKPAITSDKIQIEHTQ